MRACCTLLLPALLAVGLAATGCESAPETSPASPGAGSGVSAARSPTAASPPAPAPTGSAQPVPQPPRPGPKPVSSGPLHATTQEQLLGLLDLPAVDPPAVAKRDDLLRRTIKPGSPAFMNQGNPELSHHAIDRRRCLEGLAGITLQTPAERRRCQGRQLMVPIYPEGGRPDEAKTCIDIFEFPNQPCELPFVWAGPTLAQQICRALGKRLCTQAEWVLACGGDPGGGPPSRYAYGDALDLTACNTSKPSAKHSSKQCDPSTVRSAWQTCSTNTEPAGSYPRCRSRFGVYDLHGNVAEAMTRKDPDGTTYSQLKGSAFFYVDVHRQDGDRKKDRKTYPDHCAHDPRWHVEQMDHAWHVNYHLGFRCCLTIGE